MYWPLLIIGIILMLVGGAMQLRDKDNPWITWSLFGLILCITSYTL